MEQNSYNIDNDSYKNHIVFSLVDDIISFYDNIAENCYQIIPNGTLGICNYETHIYYALKGTLTSVKSLLLQGYINDGYTLVRKYYDDILVDLYFDVIRTDKFDVLKSIVVEDVNNWLHSKHRIPCTKSILKTLKSSPQTKQIFTLFGWDSYLKHNREFLDDSVHSNRYSRLILNCNTLMINRENHLSNCYTILKQLFILHLVFIFCLNPTYMRASDYLDSLEMNVAPIKDSENWIAPFALNTFNKYIRPINKFSEFVIANCSLNFEI